MSLIYTYDVYVKDFASKVVSKIASNTGKAFSTMVRSQQKFNAGNHNASRSISQLENRLQSLREKRNRSFSTKEIAKFNGYIRKTEIQLRKLENLPPQSFRQRLSNTAGKFSGMIGLAGGVGVALGAWRGITGVLKLGADAEQTQIKFETLLGSATGATKMIGDLEQLAQKTPLKKLDLQRNAELLLNFGIAGNKILPTLQKIGDVSGGNRQRFDSLSLAYAQATSTGRLMGQDLNQMINAGFNPLQVISEQTGESMASLKKKMEAGAISATMLEQAFTIATSKGGRFYQMLERQSETVNGRFSTLLDMTTKLGTGIGNRLIPTAHKFIDAGMGIINFLSELPFHFTEAKRVINENAESLGLIAVAVSGLSYKMMIAKSASLGYTAVTKAQTVWTGIATTGQWLWNAALTANPIGAIIAGLALLGAGAVWAYKKVGWFRGAVLASWEAIKGFAGAIKNYALTRIGELLRGITGIGKALWQFVKGDWSKALETGKQATKDLFGVGTKGKFIADMKDTGKKAGEAYRRGVIEVSNEKKTGKAFSKLSNKDKAFQTKGFFSLGNGVGETGAIPTGATSVLSGSNAVTSGIDSITGGGKKQTNITIQIQSLVEELKIISQNVTEGADELEDKVKEIFLRIVNSANQIQTV